MSKTSVLNGLATALAVTATHWGLGGVAGTHNALEQRRDVGHFARALANHLGLVEKAFSGRVWHRMFTGAGP